MNISYKALAQLIAQMPVERQEDDVTVLVSGVGEVYAVLEAGPVEFMDQQGDVSGVLDDGHFVLKI